MQRVNYAISRHPGLRDVLDSMDITHLPGTNSGLVSDADASKLVAALGDQPLARGYTEAQRDAGFRGGYGYIEDFPLTHTNSTPAQAASDFVAGTGTGPRQHLRRGHVEIINRPILGSEDVLAEAKPNTQVFAWLHRPEFDAWTVSKPWAGIEGLDETVVPGHWIILASRDCVIEIRPVDVPGPVAAARVE